tara:strand:+ start:453 stop:968 length:516 start_codon:yes stop_codon:yes gene_type:complete
MSDSLILEAKEKKNEMISSMSSIILSTISKQGEPNSSYAPSVVDCDGNFYIYISSLSKHTSNLEVNSKLSLMIIEDESKAENIFGRKRFTMDADSHIIERDSSEWRSAIDMMEQKFGDTVKFLKDMTDFHMFKIIPFSGLLVHGFARAFNFYGEGLSEIRYLNEKGHTQKK